MLTDTYIRQPTEPRDEPAVNLQISLRTEPPTARASTPSASKAAKTARVAGAISHFAPVRLGKRPSSRARHHARSCLFDATWLDAAVLKDGRDIDLPGLAAGDRAEDHECCNHKCRTSNEQPNERRIIQDARCTRLLLARHVDVCDVDDCWQQEKQDVFSDDADHLANNLWCMFFMIPAVTPQMYLS